MTPTNETLVEEVYAKMHELEALVAPLDPPMALKRGDSILPSLVLVVMGTEAAEEFTAAH
jgi:hypothetical protein